MKFQKSVKNSAIHNFIGVFFFQNFVPFSKPTPLRTLLMSFKQKHKHLFGSYKDNEFEQFKNDFQNITKNVLKELSGPSKDSFLLAVIILNNLFFNYLFFFQPKPVSQPTLVEDDKTNR